MSEVLQALLNRPGQRKASTRPLVHKRRIAALELRRAGVRRREEGLLGVEHKARQELNRRAAAITAEIRTLRREERSTRRRSAKEERLVELERRLGQRFHRLSLEPLRWRNKDGLPRLAVFRLDSPDFCIANWQAQGETKLPGFLRTLFRDVRRKFYRVTACFTGVIPTRVKRLIAKVQEEKIFSEILIIAEVENWKVEQRAVVPVGDPLVVGVQGPDLWLIADFDTTSVEDLVFFTLPKPRRRK